MDLLILQRDPVGIAGAFNVYEYCFGNPVNLVDPEGGYPFGGFPNMPGKPRPPKPKPRPSIYVDLEAELRKEERLQMACYAGLLVVGGWEAWTTKSIIGLALDLAGWWGWGWTYF